jgi:4a-hydroxytetrahydrobiopterin dehydratase
MKLVDRRCVDLPKGTPKLDASRIAALSPEVPDWAVQGDRLVRTFSFKDFDHAMRFVNELAGVARAEDHHPDFTVRYSKVEVSTWTHTVNGLSDNDFILAAKLDRAFGSL